MMNGVVYAAFGSHCDRVPYEGWIVGVSTSGGVVTKWATTPSGHGAAIWQSGTGLMSDGSGQIVFGTGNGMVEAGVWDPAIGATPAEAEGKLGESVARVQVQAGGHLKTTDFFSPFSDKELDEKDLDIGSSAPVGLPSPYFGNGGAPNLLVQEGKQGWLYLLDATKIRTELGWEPTIEFETGLAETVAWYADNRDWWEPLRDRAPIVETAWAQKSS